LVSQEREVAERYDQLMQAWTKKLERIENRRRAKDHKTRDFFEKIFPELKKQREDKERLQR
jgi:nuclear receptor co-repressor 1